MAQTMFGKHLYESKHLSIWLVGMTGCVWSSLRVNNARAGVVNVQVDLDSRQVGDVYVTDQTATHREVVSYGGWY